MKSKEQIQSAIDELSPFYTEGCDCEKCKLFGGAIGVLNWVLDHENDHGFDHFVEEARRQNNEDQFTITE